MTLNDHVVSDTHARALTHGESVRPGGASQPADPHTSVDVEASFASKPAPSTPEGAGTPAGALVPAGVTPRLTSGLWTKASYGPTLRGSGAAKLADSGVAPLVALARGYYSVHDKEGAHALATKSVAGKVDFLKRRLPALVTHGEDILAMPWHALSRVAEEGLEARSYNTQYRPSRPELDAETGKAKKYAWFPGERLVLDMHPATPMEKVDGAIDIILTEGIIKGDSALTSMLLSAGVTLAVLSETPATVEQARVRLQDIMRGTRGRLIPIVNSASVTTWEDQNDQWRHLRLTDKRVIIAFDGDLAENRMVWKQTQKAMTFVRERKGKPSLLSMFTPEVELAQVAAGMDPSDKLGIDDYLSRVGDWEDLLSLTTGTLPPEPEATERAAVIGSWRVHPDNDARVQEYTQEPNPDGSKKPAQWMDRYRIGGRVLSTSQGRIPDVEETESGLIDPENDYEVSSSHTLLEVAMLSPLQDHDQEPERFTLRGPATLLMSDKGEWVRLSQSGKMNIPGALLAHPEWPPRKFEDWRSAVKANRADERDDIRTWDVMGWAPTTFGEGVFILGRDVLASTESIAASIRPGVSDHNRHGANRYGLHDEWFDKDEAEYKAQVLRDIRTVCDLYTGLTNDATTGVLLLGAAYRATIPLRSQTVIELLGVPGTGKTQATEYILRPQSRRASTLGEDLILGTADDTVPQSEVAASQMPVWAADDHSAQKEQRKADAQEGSVSQLVRRVFGGQSRNRMGDRPVPPPRCVLILSSENGLSINSIRQRLWEILTGGDLYREAGMRAFSDEFSSGDSNALTRTFAAMARYWVTADAHQGRPWGQRTDGVKRMRRDAREQAIEEMVERGYGRIRDVARQAGKVADLAIVSEVMYNLWVWAGGDEASAPALFGDDENSMFGMLIQRSSVAIRTRRSTTPAMSLLTAISNLLRENGAYLDNPTTPGTPPWSDIDVADVDSRAQRALSTGWRYDQSRSSWVVGPGQKPIGALGITTEGTLVASFSAAAWREAQKAYPDLLPAGMKPATTWDDVASSGFTVGAPDREEGNTQRVSLRSDELAARSTRHSGVVVDWKRMVDAVNGVENDSEEDLAAEIDA